MLSYHVSDNIFLYEQRSIFIVLTFNDFLSNFVVVLHYMLYRSVYLQCFLYQCYYYYYYYITLFLLLYIFIYTCEYVDSNCCIGRHNSLEYCCRVNAFIIFFFPFLNIDFKLSQVKCVQVFKKMLKTTNTSTVQQSLR